MTTTGREKEDDKKKEEKKATPPGPRSAAEIEEKFKGFIEGAANARAYGKKASVEAGEEYIDLGDRYASESKTNVNDMMSDLAKKVPATTPEGVALQATLEDVRKANERMARNALNGDDDEYAVQKKEFEAKCAEANKQYAALVKDLSEKAKTADVAAAKDFNEKLEALKKAEVEKQITNLQTNIADAQITEMQRFADAQLDKDKQKVLSIDATGKVAELGYRALKKWHDVRSDRSLNSIADEQAKIGGGPIVPSGIYYQKTGTSLLSGEPQYDKRMKFEVSGDDKGNYTVRAQIDHSKQTSMGLLVSIFRGDKEFRRNAWEAHLMMNAGDKKRPLSLVKKGETGGETYDEKVKRCEQYCEVMGAGPHLKRLNLLLQVANEKRGQGFDVPIDFDADVAALRKAPDVDIFALTKFEREMEKYKRTSAVNIGPQQLEEAKKEIQEQKAGAHYVNSITSKDPDPADALKLLSEEGKHIPAEIKEQYENDLKDFNQQLKDGGNEPKTSAEKHIVNEVNGIRALHLEITRVEEGLTEAMKGLSEAKDQDEINKTAGEIKEYGEQLTSLRQECVGLGKLHEDHVKFIRPLADDQCSKNIKTLHENLGKRLEPDKLSIIEHMNPDKLAASHERMQQLAQEAIQKAQQRLGGGGPKPPI